MVGECSIHTYLKVVRTWQQLTALSGPAESFLWALVLRLIISVSELRTTQDLRLEGLERKVKKSRIARKRITAALEERLQTLEHSSGHGSLEDISALKDSSAALHADLQNQISRLNEVIEQQSEVIGNLRAEIMNVNKNTKASTPSYRPSGIPGVDS
jgi:hypothetical protein